MKNLKIKNAARGLLGRKRKSWLLALVLLAAALPAAGMPREACAEEIENETAQHEESEGKGQMIEEVPVNRGGDKNGTSYEFSNTYMLMSDNPPGDSKNLKDFQVDAKLNQGNTEIHDGDTVIVGEHYTYTVWFEEKGHGEFSDEMYLKLPDNVTCKPVKDQPVYDTKWEGHETDPAGWYDVDEKGNVTFRLNPDYDKVDRELMLWFDLTVADGGEGKDLTLPWKDGETKTFKTKIDSDATLEKTAGKYTPNDLEGPCIDYTVELDITRGAVKNPTIEDTPGPGLSYRENSATIVVYEDDGKTVHEFPEGEEPKLVQKEDGTWWKIEGLPETLSKGQKVVIKYKCDVDIAAINGTENGGVLDFTAENKAVFNGKYPVGDGTLTREDDGNKNFSDTILKKSGSKDTTDLTKYPNDMDWEIELGSGSTDVRDSVVTDTLEGNHWFNEDRPLELKWKDENGHTIKTYYIPWREAAQYGLTPHYKNEKIDGFTFDIPDEGKKYTGPESVDGETFWKFTDSEGNERTWQEGDRLKIEYYTTYDPTVNSQDLGNKVHVDAEPYEFGVDREIGVGATSISKNIKDEGEYLEYTVEMDIPAAADFIDIIGKTERVNSKGETVVADTPGDIYFYIKDQLEFESVTRTDESGNELKDEDGKVITDRYFVKNVPDVISIIAIMEDGSTVTFAKEDSSALYYFHVATNGTYNNSDGLMKGNREFQIWFNAMDSKENSRWKIEEACRLVITYKIPTNAKLVLESPQYTDNWTETELTVQDLLDQNQNLTNEVWGKGRGERDLSTKKKYKRPRPEGGVDKKAEIKTLDDGQKVIEYTVKFNGFTTDPVTGEFGKIPIDPKTFKLTDVFDSKLQYVSGSLYVDVYSPENRHRYRFAYPVGEDPVTTEKDDGTTTLIAEAEKFTRRISQDEGGGEDHDYEALHDYMWSDSKKEVKPRDALYIFVYQLELKDENIKGKSEIELHNKATVAYGDKSKSDDAVVYFTPEVLKKEGMHTHEDPTNIDIMEYTIYVNPGATDMVTAEGGIDIGRFTLTDQMDEILELKLDSVKVSRVDKETGEETLLTQVTDINEVKPGADCYVVQEGKGNTLKLTLPDNAYLKITYSAYIGATMNTSGSVTNTVTMDADITITESNTAEYEMDGSGGRMSGNDGLRLYKQDSSTGNYIDGAVFEVYTLKKDGGGESADSKKLQVQINEGGQETFEQFGGDISPNAKTGAPIAPKEDYDGYYLLVEKAAPDGYVPDPKPVVFKFAEKKTETEEGKETVPEKETVKVKYFEEDEKNYHEYEVEVQYIQPGDNVVIFENKPDVYELPETGGFGSMTYTLAGLLLIFGGAFCLMYRRNRIQKGGW